MHFLSFTVLNYHPDIYASYAFANKLNSVNRALPRVHMIAKNRLTHTWGQHLRMPRYLTL